MWFVVFVCAGLSSIARDGAAQVAVSWSVPVGAGWPSASWDTSEVWATMTLTTANSPFNPDMLTSFGTNPRGLFTGPWPSYMKVYATGAIYWNSVQQVDVAITHVAMQVGLIARRVTTETMYGCLVSGGDNLQIFKQTGNNTYTVLKQAAPIQKITHLGAAGDPVSPWYTLQFQVIQSNGQASLSCGLWQQGAPPAQAKPTVFVNDATTVLNILAPSKSGVFARSGASGFYGYFDNYSANPMGC